MLRTQREVDSCFEQVRQLGLPVILDSPKVWDSLAALDLILKTTTKKARVLDAGGEYYSMILPWLFLYGYNRLTAGNLAFGDRTKYGPIVYEHMDITNTTYPDGVFDAITCLSVIEHGVDLDAYFAEMSRLLKVGGVLVTSTDYWTTPIDTRDQEAFGVPVHVFTRPEICDAMELAQRHGLVPVSELDLRTDEKVVHWDRFDLRYTYAMFSLKKAASTRFSSLPRAATV